MEVRRSAQGKEQALSSLPAAEHCHLPYPETRKLRQKAQVSKPGAKSAPSTPYPHLQPRPVPDSLVRETPRGLLTSTAQHRGSSNANSNISQKLAGRKQVLGEEGGCGEMCCAPTLRKERDGWSAGEGYFQPKEVTSSSRQLDSSIASGQWGLTLLPIWGGLSPQSCPEGVPLFSYQW